MPLPHTLRRALALVLPGSMAMAAFPVGTLAAQLSVDRLELVITPARAAQRGAYFSVLNGADTAVSAAVYVGDWDRSDLGELRFYAPGTRARSCAHGLRVSPAVLRIPPRGVQPVEVTFDADGVGAECWAMVFVEGTRPADQDAGHEVVSVVRAGVEVYVQPAAVVSEATIEDMQLVGRAAGGAARELVVTVRNTGTAHFVARGTVEIRRPDNSVLSSTTVENLAVLPGAVRRLSADIPPLPPGRYLVLVLVDHGGKGVAAGQLEFEAP
ncbi:MAG TPA: hypothetical protein VNA89_12450 [Gemmatimonadaceae bacterium]|nr:hypothetical protein [Gemmatimonadaceae bacterium]